MKKKINIISGLLSSNGPRLKKFNLKGIKEAVVWGDTPAPIHCGKKPVKDSYNINLNYYNYYRPKVKQCNRVKYETV